MLNNGRLSNEWEISDGEIGLALQKIGFPTGKEDIKEVRDFLDEELVADKGVKAVSLENQTYQYSLK